MKPKDPTDPQLWLSRAKANLNLAVKGGRLSGVVLEDLYFNAQQAAEKLSNALQFLSVNRLRQYKTQ